MTHRIAQARGLLIATLVLTGLLFAGSVALAGPVSGPVALTAPAGRVPQAAPTPAVALPAAAVPTPVPCPTCFDWTVIPTHFFDAPLLQGAVMTIFLAVVAQVAGVILGLFAALMKMSKNIVLNGIAGIYIWLFRGTPLLVQLIVFATGLYEIGIKLDLLTSALLAFSINEGAYMAEIIRAGIQSIDPGQMEAAKSLGMTYGLSMRRIVLPQAARVILPPLGNEFNNMLKSTSLASTIGIAELLQAGGDLNHRIFKSLEVFTIISCYYLAMTTVVTILQSWAESRLGDRRSSDRNPGLWDRLRTNILSTRRAV